MRRLTTRLLALTTAIAALAALPAAAHATHPQPTSTPSAKFWG